MIRVARNALRDERGTMVIETALIAPILAALALGAFDISMMTSREQHVQSAANEATEIVLAASGGSGISSTDLKAILVSSLNLEANNVTLTTLYRCGTSNTTSSTPPPCTGDQLYSYVKLTITDTYSPMWTHFGVGHDITFNGMRTVQVA